MAFEPALERGTSSTMSRSAPTTELRIPADPAYIVVAKRTAAGLASVGGFGVEAVDELNIAIAQACERTISLAREVASKDATIRVSFRLEETVLTVDVRLQPGRSEAAQRQAAAAPPPDVDPTGVAAPAPASWPPTPDALDLALQMIGLFADDVRCRVAGNGLLHVRLAKYRWR
ncbi:MAG TPA: hypothetical protein VNN74_04430 [Candidatus Micrarchaeia archaeon]|nr:hypothetical protein [Candidatus Micrarchaeia archaeon]